MEDERVLKFGFHVFYPPVSYNADADPSAPGFNTHLGYEADILTALEAMEGAGLSFVRRPIAAWEGVWLQSASPDYDVIGGGITIRDSRTRDASGEVVVVFTSGHITFRQTLLVRTEDSDRLAAYGDLTSDVIIGTFVGTTNESRLLQLTGMADSDGVLVDGVRVDTPRGTVIADGSADYFITAAGESPNLIGRQRLYPPDDTKPQVVYLAEELSESERLGMLRDGDIDAIAGEEIGLRAAHSASGGAFVVTAHDTEAELGGFTLDADEPKLASCLSEKTDWLTDDRRIGFAEWLEDPLVFMRRAEMWNER